jgi:hypothetical protein
MLVLTGKAFYLAASHRQMKKLIFSAPSLPDGRQGRLCGENPIWKRMITDTTSFFFRGLYGDFR